MEQRESRRPPEYILEVFADPTSIKDVVRGVLALRRSSNYPY